MPQCAVLGCSNSHRKTKGAPVRYHRFPSDGETRARWVLACGRHPHNADTARVCSRHFATACYEPAVLQVDSHGIVVAANSTRSRLRKGAVPHLFLDAKESESVKKLNRVELNCNKNKLKTIKPEVYKKTKSLKSSEDKSLKKKGKNHIKSSAKCLEFIDCWKDKAFPVLFAVGLIPISRKSEQSLKNLNRMLVMEESEELQDKKASSTNFKEDSENPTSTSDDIVTSENCEDLKKENTKEIVNNEVKCEDVEEVSADEKKDISQNDVTFDNSIQDEPQNLSNNTNISSEPMKRNLEDNLDGPNKKSKPNHFENDTDIKIINDIFESAGNLSLQEVQDNEHKLLSDIECLNEQMKEKEREWNQILHLKKMKEELLIRLQRKRDVMLISNSRDIDWEMALDMHMKKNTLNNNNNGISGINLAAFNLSNSGVTVMPVSSTSPSKSPKMNSILIDGMNLKQPKSDRNLLGSMINRQRSILPKPLNASNNFMLPSVTEYNGLQKTGPKGQPMMDVNSIVEKFRLNHPEEVPRRTRRGKIKNIRRSDVEIVTSSKRPPGALINSTVQSIPNRVDPHSELGIMLASSTSDNINIRPRSFPSNDTLPHTRMHTNPAQISNPPSVSFKDVLVQFARLSQSERREIQAQANVNNFLLQQGANAMNVKPPPPPYPEVTLHPVINNGATTVTSNSQQSNSLLHGILTKNQSKTDSKSFTTLSPTLARLLTGANSHPSDVSDINDLLSNAQNQSLQLHSKIDKTESPLNFGSTSGQIPTTSSASQPNSHSVVNLDDAEAEDSADRLVIDESNETATNNVKNVDENTEENEGSSSGPVPTCQGCKENPAQFVCAGCTSQWYCSRDCQVSDWDDHCEVCSG